MMIPHVYGHDVSHHTYNIGWHGPSHVKESITLKESKIISVLHPPKASNNGSFSMSSALFGSPSSTPERKSHNRTPKYSSDVTVDVPMEGAGSSSKRELLNQICQEISHKQLTPTIRVQYMRTAYQIPFDAGLRVTLDTNVVMVAEWTKETLSGRHTCTTYTSFHIHHYIHLIAYTSLHIHHYLSVVVICKCCVS